MIAAFAKFILSGLVGLIILLLIIEWAVGCGETYTDSKGVVHANTCFLINQSKGK